MKKVLLIMAATCITMNCFAQTHPNTNTLKSKHMKLNAGILTEKLAKTNFWKFYKLELLCKTCLRNSFFYKNICTKINVLCILELIVVF